MAHAEASASLDTLPRRTTRTGVAATTCDRCGEQLTARPGDVVWQPALDALVALLAAATPKEDDRD